MALASKSRNSPKIKPVLKSAKISPLSEWLRPTVTGIVLLLLVGLGLDALNQGGISCFFPKRYSLKLVGHIRGAEQSCGAFKVGGIAYLKGQGIAVFDSDQNRYLLFDMKGQFLQILSTPVSVQSKTATDSDSGLTYTADWDRHRVVVTDQKGKIQKNIYVRDHPTAVALDGKGHLFVGFGNHYFLQAYSFSGRLKGDGLVENAGPDATYLDVISLSGTDQGLLLAADPYSVWIYQLPN